MKFMTMRMRIRIRMMRIMMRSIRIDQMMMMMLMPLMTLMTFMPLTIHSKVNMENTHKACTTVRSCMGHLGSGAHFLWGSWVVL